MAKQCWQRMHLDASPMTGRPSESDLSALKAQSATQRPQATQRFLSTVKKSKAARFVLSVSVLSIKESSFELQRSCVSVST
jgi:hypothetical protein